MKKYGLYAYIEGSKKVPWLIREFDTLKDANREAYRLARYYFRNAKYLKCEFIVGNNTGITLNSVEFNEYIRYSIENCIIFDDIFGWIYVYWGNELKHDFLVKAGVVKQEYYKGECKTEILSSVSSYYYVFKELLKIVREIKPEFF